MVLLQLGIHKCWKEDVGVWGVCVCESLSIFHNCLWRKEGKFCLSLISSSLHFTYYHGNDGPSVYGGTNSVSRDYILKAHFPPQTKVSLKKMLEYTLSQGT